MLFSTLLFGCTGGGGSGDSAGYSFDGSNLEGTGAGKTLTISGTLLDDRGQPIPDAKVQTPEGTATKTDNVGRFTLLTEERASASLTFTTDNGSFEVPLGSTVALKKLSFTASIDQNKEISANNIAVEPDVEPEASQAPTNHSNFSPHDDDPPATPSPAPFIPEATPTLPPAGVCGDGIIDPGEQCDDGNLARADGCGPACRLETCGNGIINQPEQCDDGNKIPGDGCSDTCKFEV